MTRTTNVEFITELMEHGNPLKQAFVIEALTHYSKAVAEAKPEDLDRPFLSGQAWHDCATEILKAVEKRYES